MQKIHLRSIKEPDLSGNFGISNVNDLLAENDMVEKIHRHDFFFVLAVEKGTGEHQIDFTNYPVSDYSVFLVRPGQIHQLLLKRGSKGYLMGFDPGFYSPGGKQKKQMFRVASRNNFYRFNTSIYKGKLFSVFEWLYNEYSTRRIMYKEGIKANLDLFFLELFRQAGNSNISTDNNSYTQELLEELLEMLEIHFCENKQVTFYAQKLNLTPYQLNTITKNTLGKTYSQLINERIILEAKRNLLATSNQVKEIAYQLCYDDPSYFIRFFKKHTGLTPEAFRLNFQ